MIKSKLKCLLITFFNVKGLVHYEFLPEGQTINQHYYIDVLPRLRKAVPQKRPEKWHQKNWLLHHGNSRPHTALTVQLFLAKNGIALLLQPPYFPDLAPNDSFFTLKFKNPWKMAISEPKSAHLRDALLFAFNWKKSATEAH
ncbi:hypothetical protein LAZ67_14003037 [Cordylochernes scorpioides]|uniref:Transposase n=1 Tax=Cordylochernes scorpioides TaxID=51811 RepID=A0ABY6L797_9ARAC|nr:hypothetical protein LAZ67_14003037 [Cordylochernes scorpioides]